MQAGYITDIRELQILLRNMHLNSATVMTKYGKTIAVTLYKAEKNYYELFEALSHIQGNFRESWTTKDMPVEIKELVKHLTMRTDKIIWWSIL